MLRGAVGKKIFDIARELINQFVRILESVLRLR
jgi:hypothetical protein